MYDPAPAMKVIPRKSNTHLQQWLHCKHLIKNVESDNIIKSSSNAIIESFGGFNCVLECLIEHGNEIQLKLIYDIIKKERLKYLKQMELTKATGDIGNINMKKTVVCEGDSVSDMESDIVILNCSINVTNDNKFQFF